MTPTIAGMLGVLVGVLVGAAIAFYAFHRSFQVAGRYHVTGSVTPPAAAPREPRVANAEAKAHARMMEDAVARGAKQILEAAKEQGIPMTQAMAEKEAREMLKGVPPLGGAQ